MDDRRVARARRARRWTGGLLAGAGVLAAAQPAAATPFVVVDAALERSGDRAVVTGTVTWNREAARAEPHRMTVGDLRLVATADGSHRPTLLAAARADDLADRPTQPVRFVVDAEARAAIRPGNRVVLTASQHGRAAEGMRSERTYVTVAQLQPFATPQDRIGRRDCSDVAIEPGAQLQRCDLVGAHLDDAIVSVRKPAATRMLLADLTGATLVDADLTGLSVAGGRLNGADATRAILDNLSLAGAEAVGLIARDATSDRLGGTAGADVFAARLDGTDFRGALLNGVSLGASRFVGADFRDATFNAVLADAADFRRADLRGLRGVGTSVYLADFTDARLGGAALTAADLAWATLCRTEMPDGRPPDGEDRDCRERVGPGPEPAPDRIVEVVDTAIERGDDRAVVRGTIRWSLAAIRRLTVGDVRAVAIDRTSGLPTTLGTMTVVAPLAGETRFATVVTDPAGLAALERGNRVVLTATQHPPAPALAGTWIDGVHVTVATVQAGPGRGRIGSRDCSGLLLSAVTPAPGGYDFCDLAGASLRRTQLAGSMRLVDLTGADLEGAALRGLTLDGAALGGVAATGADVASVSLAQAWAPGLSMPGALIRAGQLRAARLDGADFSGSTISETTLATAPLRSAAFSRATFDKVDLAYADLDGARLDGVEAEAADPRRARRSSLFLADLTDATLAGSAWDDDEAGDRPWRWATLCRTVLPVGAGAGADADPDRDCPALRP